MYIPKSFENKDISELQQFIEKYNFATVISYGENGMHVSHVPVMLEKTQGQFGTLIWHLAKLNEHCKALSENQKSLVIFHGPHAYISPAWYKSSPNVPTWNYAVVHAHGLPVKVSKKQLSMDLEKFVSRHESNLVTPYQVQENHKIKLLEHIEGFHMEITNIEGKFKLGQNRSSEDQNNMLEELLKQHSNQDALALAEFMKKISQ